MKNKKTGNLILLGLCLSTFMTSIDGNIVSVGLSTIEEGLNTSFSSVQWVILSYLLSVTVLIVGAGRIGDLFGKKRIYLIGIMIFTVMSVICGLSTSIVMLITARVLQGIGGAILMALSFAFVGDLFPKEKIPMAMGIVTSMLTLGIALGPSLGGILIGAFGWHIIFLINIPIGAVTFIIALRFPKSEAACTGQRFDWLGVLALAAALICYNFAMTYSESQGLSSGVLMLSMLSIISIAAFIAVERKVSSPLINLKIFKDRTISISLVICVIVYAMINAMSIILPYFLSIAKGLPMSQVGLLMAIGPFVTTFMGPIAGKAAVRLGNRPVILGGILGFGVGCFLMATLTQSTSTLGFAIRIAIANGSFAFFQTPNSANIIAAAKPGQRGVFSGILNLARALGQTTGVSFMGAIFAYFAMTGHGKSASSASPAAIISGVHGTFLFAFAVVLIAGIIGMFTMQHNHK